MKLRLHRDSIRLRLTPDDVAALQASGQIVERTGFAAGNELSYRITLSKSVAQPSATFAGSDLTVELPAGLAIEWAEGETVGIRHEQSIADGRTLTILIEKDFECLDEPADEQDQRFYPNPKKACR